LTTPAPPQTLPQIATRMGESWGPWHGCPGAKATRSPVCPHCYAVERQMPRYKRYRGHEHEVEIATRHSFLKPLYWTQYDPKMVFVCPWGDFFVDDPTADNWRPHAWKIMNQTWWHTYRICTKFPGHIQHSLPDDWWPNGYENVWLGVSVENQVAAKRISYLQQVPAKLKWVSAEPLMGPVDLTPYLKDLGWVIAGGMSGDSKHPSINPPERIQWFLDLAQQCKNAKVPFMLKQLGGDHKCTCHRPKNPTAPSSPPHEPAYGCRVIANQVFEEFP
jgi:protein gp37